LGFGHIVPATELQGREYRLALDDRSMRKIKAAEAETTRRWTTWRRARRRRRTNRQEVANDDGIVQTPPDLVGQQGPLTPAVSFDDLYEVRSCPAR